MAEERNYYVICDDNCRFPAMTKEEVIAAIAEATGATPTHIDDAFITKIKESNKNGKMTFWIGSQAEYNALPENQKNIQNRFYIFYDEGEMDDIEADVAELKSEVEELQQKSPEKDKTIFSSANVPFGVLETPKEISAEFLNYKIVRVGDVLCGVTDFYPNYIIAGTSAGAVVPSDWDTNICTRQIYMKISKQGDKYYITEARNRNFIYDTTTNTGSFQYAYSLSIKGVY